MGLEKFRANVGALKDGGLLLLIGVRLANELVMLVDQIAQLIC